ncbi:protein translocase subunit SecF [Patescibacteria group bacterium]|nr:protein translocase subunit SecF [Patescibacteria group bacterium]MBU4274612.1 protein translocase subunit SecF [Patescibacteria group bacterium]MBU4367658.1 protein translocase subunit SecF [Patescibacteria group bacterium]MBU4461892.1 protein translocase subunit SecF [Patescibacteria group bacterium]MCG2699977.1 protein translocase subunit SecF [Candidatus Parcubacteria bacterium]
MNIQFLKITKIYYLLSLLLLVLAVVCLLSFGLKFGIDFTGGSILEVEFENRPSNQLIQEKINNLELGEIIIQPRGEREVVIKTKEIDSETHQKIVSQLQELSNLEEKGFENIGPTIGRELREKTIVLVVVSLIVLLVYISIAFKNVSWPLSSWQYGVISIIALTFDVLLTIGFFAILGKYYNAQFNIPVITALLTILGYTINDKVIIFDRVRESLLKRRGDDFKELVNKSLNETIFRSLSTGTCTLLVLFAIFLLGGETLKYFSLTLIVGIVAGTYSSLFLAAPLLVTWLKWKERKSPNI